MLNQAAKIVKLSNHIKKNRIFFAKKKAAQGDLLFVVGSENYFTTRNLESLFFLLVALEV